MKWIYYPRFTERPQTWTCGCDCGPTGICGMVFPGWPVTPDPPTVPVVPNPPTPPNTGWLCPKCGRANAPWMPWCGCAKPETVEESGP